MDRSGQPENRLRRFRDEMAHVRLTDPVTAHEARWLGLGVAALVLGLALGVVAYLRSHSTTVLQHQRADRTLALAGVAIAVLGATLVVRYAIAGFLRSWLADLVTAQRAQSDRMVAAPRPGADDR